MLEGLPDSAITGAHVPVGRWGRIAKFLWQHSFRAVLVVLVLLVIFTAARQTSRSGSQTGPAPTVAETIVREVPPPIDWARQYAWLSKSARSHYEPLLKRVTPPDGFARVEVERGSYADWLRHLPVAPKERPVTNYRRQTVFPAGDGRVAAVIELQPGAGNLLLNPAMSVRLRAEYLWSAQSNDKIAFHYTSGHEAAWGDWVEGKRPIVQGKKVTFKQDRARDDSRDSFCSYLETLFKYTTVYSVFQDTEKTTGGSIAAGDMFVVAGRFGGYVVIVLDVATSSEGRVRVLLGRGGNPAQTFHALRAEDGDPWFAVSQSSGIRLGGREQLKLKDLRRWTR